MRKFAHVSDNITIPTEVKKQLCALRLTRIKKLHTKWIHELYQHIRKKPEIITNGFEAAGIKEACLNARTYATRVENPFRRDGYVVAY